MVSIPVLESLGNGIIGTRLPVQKLVKVPMIGILVKELLTGMKLSKVLVTSIRAGILYWELLTSTLEKNKEVAETEKQ